MFGRQGKSTNAFIMKIIIFWETKQKAWGFYLLAKLATEKAAPDYSGTAYFLFSFTQLNFVSSFD